MHVVSYFHDYIINQGQGNKTARAIQIHQGETINHQALLNLFRAIITNNRAGGWRKLKQSSDSCADALHKLKQNS